MHFKTRAALALAMPIFALTACSPDLSPNTYNSAAVQQANKVDQGVVVGVRQVDVKVSGNTGAVAGAAAGGVVGGSLPGSTTGQALGTVGGGLIGGLLGSSVEQAAGDTKAWEYIVRKKTGELVSVTQTGETPLAIGQNVLVIAGSQARIVPDYTVKVAEEPAKKPVEAATPLLSPVTPPPAAPASATDMPVTPPDADAKPAAPAAAPAPAVVVPATSNPEAAAAEKLFTTPTSATSDPALPVPITVPSALGAAKAK